MSEVRGTVGGWDVLKCLKFKYQVMFLYIAEYILTNHAMQKERVKPS